MTQRKRPAAKKARKVQAKRTVKYTLTPTRSRFATLVLWLIGVLLIIAGGALGLVNVWAGGIWAVAGILLLPPVFDAIKSTIKRVKLASFVLILVGFFTAIIAGHGTPQSGDRFGELFVRTLDLLQKALSETANAADNKNDSASNNQPSKPSKTKAKTQKSTAGEIDCKIVGVSDGDTATCLSDDNEQLRIRFAQIDAPEKAQPFGQVAKRALSDLIYQQRVRLVIYEKDRYGRYVADVYVGEVNVNKQMVANGLAWAYKEYLRDNDYLLLEQDARTRHLGLWADKHPVYPSDYRKAKRSGNATQ